MPYSFLLYETRGHVAIITLNRPERLNALSPALSAEIDAALHEANDDPDIRAIVLTGAGRAFSAGADMRRGEDGGPESGRRDLLQWYDSTEEFFERTRFMRRLHKPVIGAINGYALGYGFELAITCDMLLASEEAAMGAPELRHGSIVASCLPLLVGPMWAKRIILTGDHVSARTAKEIGLVLEVYPPDQLMPAAIALAERIALVPPLGVRLNKRMIDGVMEMLGAEQALSYGQMVSAICHSLSDRAETRDGRNLAEIRAREGLAAFLEARDGPFGRERI